MADESVDEMIRKIGQDDQALSALVSLAKMAGVVFKQFQESGMTRDEAFALTQTWLMAMISASVGRTGDKA